MTIKATKDKEGRLAPACPRCGGPVALRAMAATIKPHQDPLSRHACPTGGMTLAEAEEWVERARAEVARLKVKAGS